MAKIRGTVRRNDLEGGHWNLEAEDGTTYVLEATASASVLKDGARVEVEGKVDDEGMSLAMTGPVLKAKSIKPV